MPKFLLRIGFLALFGFLVAVNANGATVRVERIVVHADGGFTPQTLPRHTYAPISFKGHIDIQSTDSGPVVPLEEVRLDFDKDGRLATRGLPVCPPARIEGTTTRQARGLCGGALVGTGHAEAALAVEGGASIVIATPISVFNGPRLNGRPTVVGHGRTSFPKPETYVLQIPIVREHGPYSYSATIHVPKLAQGLAAVTHVDASIGRSYKAGGVERSYTSARCSDGILETHGRLLFADGIVIEGSVFRACFVKPPRRRGR
jgi:hypothetical protein